MSTKVFYRMEISFGDSAPEDLEDKLIDMFGLSDASGSGFGGRDIAWYFNSVPKAMKAFQKIARQRSLREEIKLSLSMEIN